MRYDDRFRSSDGIVLCNSFVENRPGPCRSCSLNQTSSNITPVFLIDWSLHFLRNIYYGSSLEIGAEGMIIRFKDGRRLELVKFSISWSWLSTASKDRNQRNSMIELGGNTTNVRVNTQKIPHHTLSRRAKNPISRQTIYQTFYDLVQAGSIILPPYLL